jgi:hypothetical protein
VFSHLFKYEFVIHSNTDEGKGKARQLRNRNVCVRPNMVWALAEWKRGVGLRTDVPEHLPPVFRRSGETAVNSRKNKLLYDATSFLKSMNAGDPGEESFVVDGTFDLDYVSGHTADGRSVAGIIKSLCERRNRQFRGVGNDIFITGRRLFPGGRWTSRWRSQREGGLGRWSRRGCCRQRKGGVGADLVSALSSSMRSMISHIRVRNRFFSTGLVPER